MQRYGFVIGIRDEDKAEYLRLHEDVWPEVLNQIKRSNIENYSIFLKEPENLLFAYYEYAGEDHEADLKAMAADPKTQEWWALCMPMQAPLKMRKEGEWWAEMSSVFFME